MKFRVTDSLGNLIREFDSMFEAAGFKSLLGNPNWQIVEYERPSTAKQKAAVEWCLEIFASAPWIDDVPKFTGDINKFDDCSKYLSCYLGMAKDLWWQIREIVLENADEIW